MRRIVDVLNERIKILKCPVVVGLDPIVSEIPKVYKEQIRGADEFEQVERIITEFNKDIIDTVSDIVPAVKPQMAFYEKYGWRGVRAFQHTTEYAKSKGLIVIEDAKRNDIGSTADAYAKGHLGKVELVNNMAEAFNIDFLTVTPFLGSDGVIPFLRECELNNKGIFVLVRTSNKSSKEIQDNKDENGVSLSEQLAKYVDTIGRSTIGESGYSAIGAVVGATCPDEARLLRGLMKKSVFLVPGYGAQGGTAQDVTPCFNDDGLGAIVNSSRGILYSYKDKFENENCTRENLREAVEMATLRMRDEIYSALQAEKLNMLY